MKTTASVLRRVLYGVLCGCLAAAAAAAAAGTLVTPAATAASDPCAASEIARTIGSVATNTAVYLDSHPDTNNALTAASQQQGPQALGMVKNYFDANQQAGKDLQSLQLPLAGLTNRCKLPVSLPQVLQMMQGAQQGMPGGAALSPGLPSAQSAALPPAAGGPPPGPGIPVLAPAQSTPTPLAPAPPVSSVR